MLVVMKPGASNEDIQRVLQKVEKLGFESHTLPGPTRNCIAITGNKASIDDGEFLTLNNVFEVIRVSKPYKLVSRDFHPDNTVVKINDQVSIGDGSLVVMAGPCSVESYEQTKIIADSVKKSGAKILRGGAYKPRTSPYSFQGLKEEGLKILRQVGDEVGIPVITEVKDTETLPLVKEYSDILQIGARNMANFTLLEKVGQVNMPVMLKRGMAATIEELLLAAEYIMKEGNHQVFFCERGVRTFEPMTRNTLDLSAVVMLKRLSHLPVIVDPSHGVGINFGVPPLARAGVAIGADGIMVEVHHKPSEALSDGQQALLPEEFEKLYSQLSKIHQVVYPF